MHATVWSRYAFAAVALAGCQFSPAGGGSVSEVDASDPGQDGGATDGMMTTDASVDARIDAMVPIDAAPPPDILFLDPANELPGTGDWVINGNVSFNTDTPTGLPAGVTVTRQAQATANAREILVVHVRKLQVMPGAQLLLFGSRPMAIVAGDEVVVAGVIDASAPGPGSFDSSDVPGLGGAGSAGVDISDSGGGGGGHGTPGGRGGGVLCVGDTCTVARGAAGSPINDSRLYLGGGGAGAFGSMRPSCMPTAGGDGGGGLLIYSPVKIEVTASGRIEANGAGGTGGRHCAANGTLGGSGGGAGGQLELQSPMVNVAAGGLVVANGGAGGGGANGNSTQVAGVDGADGADSLTVATPGGAGGGNGAAPGTSGGAGSIGPGNGGAGVDAVALRNAGGGGGGAGRITITYRGSQPMVMSSPPAKFVAY